jgi:hypothetical protein
MSSVKHKALKVANSITGYKLDQEDIELANQKIDHIQLERELSMIDKLSDDVVRETARLLVIRMHSLHTLSLALLEEIDKL